MMIRRARIKHWLPKNSFVVCTVCEHGRYECAVTPLLASGLHHRHFVRLSCTIAGGGRARRCRVVEKAVAETVGTQRFSSPRKNRTKMGAYSCTRKFAENILINR